MALTYAVPDTELTTTLHNRRPTIIDNIFTGTPFLAALRMQGMVQMLNGGLEIIRGIRFSSNTTAGSFDAFDILDTTPQENETSARYPWAQEAATIAIAWTQEMKNQGEGRLVDIVDVKADDAGDTLRDTLNAHLLGNQPAAGSKDPISIEELIDIAPTAQPPRAASIGNINQADNAFWRNQQLNGGAFAVADMNQMWNDVSDGAEPPTFLLTSQNVFQFYENSQVGMIRYGDSRMGDLGFQSLMYKSRPIIWDPNVANTDRIWYLNGKYMKLCIMRGADFVPQPFVRPDNQAARVSQLLWMGNMVTDNRRRLGVIHTITAPA